MHTRPSVLSIEDESSENRASTEAAGASLPRSYKRTNTFDMLAYR